MYLSVDLALITDVLPDQEGEAAKDLGVFNIASTLPQLMAPQLGNLILNLSGDSYAAIFVACAIAGVLAAVVVVPVKGAR
jgi:MFS family permease